MRCRTIVATIDHAKRRRGEGGAEAIDRLLLRRSRARTCLRLQRENVPEPANGSSLEPVVDELASRAEDQALLEAMESHYVELKLDPEAWELYRAEVTAWDTTAGDGLSASR